MIGAVVMAALRFTLPPLPADKDSNPLAELRVLKRRDVLAALGLTVGSWLGGRFADRSVDSSLIVTLASLTLIMVVFALLMTNPLATAILVLL